MPNGKSRKMKYVIFYFYTLYPTSSLMWLVGKLSVDKLKTLFILGFSREKEQEGREGGREERFITGIGSCNYGGREVPRSALCKLKSQESGGIIQSESKDLRTRGPDDDV